MSPKYLFLGILAIIFISGCTCMPEGESCCKGEACSTASITCEGESVPVFMGCSSDCMPIWTCEPVDDDLVETPPGECLEKEGAECCLGDRCVIESPDCDSGMAAEFHGCDEDCMPDWGPCESMKYCTSADDCVPVGCTCDCSGCGGFSYEDIVNKDYVDEWYEQQGCEPVDTCPAVCCMPATIVCDDNVCVVVNDVAGGPTNMCGDGECQDWELTETHPGYCPEDCTE